MVELLDKETFVSWMERLVERFDRLDDTKNEEIPSRPMIDGIPLLDNQDVCQILKISKRTLQRYRTSKTLPYHMVYHKTWYKEDEVQEFLITHFDENHKRMRKRKKSKGV